MKYIAFVFIGFIVVALMVIGAVCLVSFLELVIVGRRGYKQFDANETTADKEKGS